MTTAINKKAVAQSFSKAASHYDSVAHLQMQMGQALLQRLPSDRSFSRALDIGCGTGQVTRHLTQMADVVTALDFAPGMLQFAREHHGDVIAEFVCADADDLPFDAGSFDLVFSNFVLQWCESLSALMCRLHDVLLPGGLLAFSLPGERTLWELKQSWRQADAQHVHVNQFPSLLAVEHSVKQAGFSLLMAERQQQTLYYPSVRALTHELKTLGAHNVNEGRSTHLTGKQTMARFIDRYESLRTAHGLPATWDIVQIVACKPD